MNRIVAHWHKFWFPASSAYNLAVCRIVIIAAQLIFFFPSLGFHIDLVSGGTAFVEPQVLIYMLDVLFPADLVFSAQSIAVIYWITAIAGCTAVIGLATRASALVFALGNWFFVALRYSYAEEHHPEALLCLFLLLLAFAPSGERLSIDALLRHFRANKHDRSSSRNMVSHTAMWPLLMMQVLLAFAYFSTGIAKLAYGGFEWMNGYTLQRYMLANAINFERSVGIWLAQQYELCYILSVATILFEVFFFICLFFRKTVPIFLIGGVLLHVGIFVTMSAPFFQHIVLYLVFIDFERYWPVTRQAQATPPVNMQRVNPAMS